MTTDRKTLLQAISKTSHYMARFECDECASVVPQKCLLDPLVPSIGDTYRIGWNGVEYTDKVLAMTDEQQARKAEFEYL